MAIQAGQPALAEDFIDKSAGASDAGKGVKLNSNGLLALSFMGIFGDGSDGDVTISSPTTLTKDMYYNNLTVNSTLTTNGYKIYVKETISGSGTIDWGTPNNGSNGGTGTGAGATGGAGGTQTGAGLLKNKAGVAGGNSANAGTAGGTLTSSIGVDGSAGGNSGTGSGATQSGGVAGTAQKPNIRLNSNFHFNLAMLDVESAGTIVPLKSSACGGGGAGSTPRGAGGGSGTVDAGGGGSGATGGIVFICAKVWDGTFTIKAIGGNGGNGGNMTGSWSTAVGGAGGGAGGTGGVSIVFYGTKTWTGSYNLAGGNGGTGGSGISGGTTGITGATGTTGTYYEIN